MVIAELPLKSPSFPLFQRGIFSVGFSLFGKEGEGEIFGRNGGGNYSTNFGSRTLGLREITISNSFQTAREEWKETTWTLICLKSFKF